MIFSWDETNETHLAKHRVAPHEAEEIIESAQPPFPAEVGDDKLVVWGATRKGRYLQVIFTLKAPDEVDYESVSLQDWMTIETRSIEQIIRIVITPRARR
jgi:uncharacterized DUF497 family protein